MLRMVWSNWWRHKERFILLLVATVLLSAGLSYLLVLSQMNHHTVQDTLESQGKLSYHIVVRPPDGTPLTEGNKYLEPNVQAGVPGGISLEQYEVIKKVAGVDVAAPMAAIGYQDFFLNLGEAQLNQIGLWRLTIRMDTHNGLNVDRQRMVHYFTNGHWSDPLKNGDSTYRYVVDQILNQISSIDDLQLVGIDPEAEARLTGLDQAVKEHPFGRYFWKDGENVSNDNQAQFPVLINDRFFDDKQYSYTYERLNLPFDSVEQATQTMEKVQQNGGLAYLEKFKEVDNQKVYTYDSNQLHAILSDNLSNAYNDNYFIHLLKLQTSPLSLSSTLSPFPEKWADAYQVQSFPMKDLSMLFRFQESFRAYQPKPPHKEILYQNTSDPTRQFSEPTFIGVFDPDKLTITKEARTGSPIDTYNQPTAKLVLDPTGQPVNPPVTIKATNNPYGLLSNPPQLLTTLEAAAMLMGDKPISVIRVRVAGVAELSEVNKQKVETVAAQIKERTGLLTDVVYGSAREPVLLQVPESNGIPALGWVEALWIKLGTSIVIFVEAQMGYEGLIGMLVLLALVYVMTSQYIAFLARRREYAILLTVGWTTRRVRGLLVCESLLVGCLAGVVVLGTQGYMLWVKGAVLTPEMFLRTAGVALLLYLLGALVPMLRISGVRPQEALRSGEIMVAGRRFVRVNGRLQMAFGHFLAKLPSG